jgi:alkylated DNA repair dioxygenase AlkB
MFSLFAGQNYGTSLLEKDGDAFLTHLISDERYAQRMFDRLLADIEWKNDVSVMYGKTIITRRKFAFYSDTNRSYRYSKHVREALIFNELLLEIKSEVEQKLQTNFNSCLLNLYHNGSEGMSWHSDDEVEMKPDGVIASLSLGAERYFDFKHKHEDLKHRISLPNGSLLVMRGQTQRHWLHRVPVQKRITGTRINLTFRQMV